MGIGIAGVGQGGISPFRAGRPAPGIGTLIQNAFTGSGGGGGNPPPSQGGPSIPGGPQRVNQPGQQGGPWQPYQTPPLPKLENTTTPDPNLTKLMQQHQQALGQSNERMDTLWNQYQGQLDSSNLDRLQDVTGSKIRDRYEGAQKGLTENLARRGMLGSGAELELQNELTMDELSQLAQSDANLALSDQSRRDALILSGMPMAAYERDRLDDLLAQGVPMATALHQLANQDKGLGLEQWQSMLGAQLQREQFGLARDVAAQNAQNAQQSQLISLLGALSPLF